MKRLKMMSGLLIGVLIATAYGCKGGGEPSTSLNDVNNTPACQADADCDAGFICNNGACEKPVDTSPKPECQKDADCTNNQICQSEKCVAPSPSPLDTKAPTISNVTPLSIPHVEIEPGSFPPKMVTTYNYTVTAAFSEAMDAKTLTVRVTNTSTKSVIMAAIYLANDGVTAGIQGQFEEKVPYKITFGGKSLAGNDLSGTVEYDVTF